LNNDFDKCFPSSFTQLLLSLPTCFCQAKQQASSNNTTKQQQSLEHFFEWQKAKGARKKNAMNCDGSI